MPRDRREYQRNWKRKKFGHQPRKKISPEDRAGIAALLSINVQRWSIARAYGVSRDLVAKVAVEYSFHQPRTRQCTA